LHPLDLALLEKRLAADGAAPFDRAALRLAGDAGLGRGGCRAEAGDLHVVARVEEQLADIRRHLLETLSAATLDRRKPLPPERALRRYPDRRHTA
jgi:flagellar biosynthesis/type III secretory pathway protein FliH